MKNCCGCRKPTACRSVPSVYASRADIMSICCEFEDQDFYLVIGIPGLFTDTFSRGNGAIWNMTGRQEKEVTSLSLQAKFIRS